MQVYNKKGVAWKKRWWLIRRVKRTFIQLVIAAVFSYYLLVGNIDTHGAGY